MPSVPAAPNRPIFLTLVLIVALGAGVAAAFVAGQLQTTFPTQQRLAAGDRPAGARHGQRGGDRRRARAAAASGWSGSAAAGAALGGS